MKLLVAKFFLHAIIMNLLQMLGHVCLLMDVTCVLAKPMGLVLLLIWMRTMMEFAMKKKSSAVPTHGLAIIWQPQPKKMDLATMRLVATLAQVPLMAPDML